jgi:uncharacterized membrane protein
VSGTTTIKKLKNILRRQTIAANEDNTAGRSRRNLFVIRTLIILLALFCAAVGFGLSNANVSVWTIWIATLVAVVALQLTWLLCIVIEHH